jgi:hypothetical protein
MLHSNKATKAFADYDATYDFQFIVSSKAPRLQQAKKSHEQHIPFGRNYSIIAWMANPTSPCLLCSF